jgi:thiol-disulfide isomerase/thioredoxin
MSRVGILLSLLLSLYCEGAIVELGISDFEAETQAATGSTTGDWLVYFYAPWCPHCRSLGPKMATFATALKKRAEDGNEKLQGVSVAKVAVPGENILLGKRFNIQGYPTLLFISRGAVHEVKERPPTTKAFADFVAKVRDGTAVKHGMPVPPPIGALEKLMVSMNTKLEGVFPTWFTEAAEKHTPQWVIDNAMTILPCLIILALVSIAFTTKLFCWVRKPETIAWLRGDAPAAAAAATKKES